MHYILHIDTSGEKALIALGRDGVLIDQVVSTDTRNHASVLNIYINELLGKAGVSLKELSAIAVCGGPGSYTGLRIGLATAKGLCYTLGKPLMLHNSLLLMALTSIYNNNNAYNQYAVVMPARDKEYFFASYNAETKTVIEPHHVEENELIQTINQLTDVLLTISNISEDVFNVLKASKDIHIDKVDNIGINGWLKYAFDRFNCNDFVSLSSAEPFYLKQVYTHNSQKNK